MKIIKIGVLLLAFVVFAGCQSNPPQKAKKPMINEQEEPNPYEQDRPSDQNKYKSPDRGLGTLDYSRDAKDATDADTQQSEKAVEDTNQ
jgi:hypothetical protein